MNGITITLTTLSAVAGFVPCGWLSVGFGFPAFAAQGGGKVEAPLKLGEERIPVGEDATIKALVELQVAIMKKGDPAKRGQHPRLALSAGVRSRSLTGGGLSALDRVLANGEGNGTANVPETAGSSVFCLRNDDER